MNVKPLFSVVTALTVQTASSIIIENALEHNVEDKIMRRTLSTVIGFGLAVVAVDLINATMK